jgi:rfaE bifunctional protein nucleotidyltransferase chain/domain
MTRLELIQLKILKWEQLPQMLAFWEFKNKKTVFTNGCFDIVHRGHMEYLSQAADLGDILIVGLNSDASVHKLKGAGRPIQGELSRAFVLASLAFINYIVIFEEETPYELIKIIQPDVLVKGSDYEPEQITGYDIVIAKSGKVVTIPLVEGYSTTNVVKKMQT